VEHNENRLSDSFAKKKGDNDTYACLESMVQMIDDLVVLRRLVWAIRKSDALY
jgi:hypothetical protein